MAYRAFDVGPFGLDTSMSVAVAPAARFTMLEARVITLADSDHPESLRPRSGLRRLLDRVFGVRRRTALADPKLEVLRRFTVLARLARGRVSIDEIESFLRAGFSPLQARALQLRAVAAPFPVQ